MIRAGKILELRTAFRGKHAKVKDFIEGQDTSIRVWLRRFDYEVSELKGLKGIQDELSEPEYKSILKDKLDVAVVNRLDTVFLTKKPAVWTWENVTKKQLQECLLEEFGCKADPVSVLLQQFGPSRLKKDPNESVSKFYHKFKEQLPALFYPETEEERKEFVDVVVRSLFYFSLEDKYLQQEISNIKDDPSLEKFYSEAVTAEAKRNSFRQIGVSSSQLDSRSGVSVSRWDTGSYNKKFPKKSEGGAVKSEQNKKEKWQSPPPLQQPGSEQQQSHQHSGAKGARPRKKCKICFKFGHWAADCYSGKAKRQGRGSFYSADFDPSQPTVEQLNEESDGSDCQAFNALHVVSSGKTIDAFATTVESPLAMNDPMMSRCIVEEVARINFE